MKREMRWLHFDAVEVIISQKLIKIPSIQVYSPANVCCFIRILLEQMYVNRKLGVKCCSFSLNRGEIKWMVLPTLINVCFSSATNFSKGTKGVSIYLLVYARN